MKIEIAAFEVAGTKSKVERTFDLPDFPPLKPNDVEFQEKLRQIGDIIYNAGLLGKCKFVSIQIRLKEEK